jgi:hypothetical protein
MALMERTPNPPNELLAHYDSDGASKEPSWCLDFRSQQLMPELRFWSFMADVAFSNYGVDLERVTFDLF